MKIPGTTHLPALLERCKAVMIQRFSEAHINQEFDLIVFGGGVNGSGIARDASERGLKVLLLEKEDFGSGCTSESTRLIHGGLRYLEHLEFSLVRESLRERELLLKNASHLVKELELCIPVYKGDKRGPLLIKLGMLLYDLLSFDKTLPSHKMMYMDDFQEYEPGIKSNGLVGGAIYYDAQISYPERLCLENVLMAKNNGGVVLNHAEVVDVSVDLNKINSVDFVDRLNGTKHTVRGKVIVNASGPWVDSLCGLTKKDILRKIGGTKGSHIVVRKFDNGPKHALYVSAKSDGRPFFIIPWQEQKQNCYLIGTTDIPFSGDLDSLKASKDEIDYLINETNNILKDVKISHNDILYSICGVRPLPYVKKSDPGSITRKHFVLDHKNEGLDNFISVGGKLTTYRSLSEEAVDVVYRKLNYNFVSSKTKQIPLLRNVGSDVEHYKNTEAKLNGPKFNIDPKVVKHLIDLYGSEYLKVLEPVKENNKLGDFLNKSSMDIAAQVGFAVSNEEAYTISDVLLRRLTLGLCEGLGEDSIPYVADYLQKHLGYTKAEIDSQIKYYEDSVIKPRKI